MVSILYISYDGILEPLGQSQVLAYLKHLSKNSRIHLISFEKEENWSKLEERSHVMKVISETTISWHPLRYHKKPTAIATSWDIACGILLGFWLVVRYKLDILHARSYVSALMALVIKKLTRAKFLFDMRGFWADERVDGGLWPKQGHMYRVTKWFERYFFLEADHVVSLTKTAVLQIERFDYLNGKIPPITIIPTCADLAIFRHIPRKRDDERFVLGYVGSAGTWYEFDSVVSCFNELYRQNQKAHFLIINHNAHPYIIERLRAGNAPMDAIELLAVSHSDVPKYMAKMDAGIFFYKQSFSRSACAPTKLGEFLGCGIPCLSNRGVGDMAELLEDEKVGVAIKAFDEDSIKTGIAQLIALTANPNTRSICISAAKKHFSLDEGVKKYQAIYGQLNEVSN